MKRTISEVIELIKEKAISVNLDINKTYDTNIEPLDKLEKMAKLQGEQQAYLDVLSLLETSHLVEQEKAIEILKDKINIVGNNNLNYYQLSLKPDKCVGDTADIMLISKEEYKVFNEVFKRQ